MKPKKISDKTASGIESTRLKKNSARISNIVLATITRRHPNRAAIDPAKRLDESAPIPMQTIKNPKTSSVTFNRSLKNGTSGAHVAEPNPETKKIARVAFAGVKTRIIQSPRKNFRKF